VKRTTRHRSGDGGGDLAALVLRLTIGPMLAYHGYNTIAGDGGLAGTTRWFDSLGLRPAHVHARAAAVTELAAGAGMALGVANPAPAAAAIGLMAVAARTDHRGKGFFVFKGGWEYTAVVAGAAAAAAAHGPGRWSVDALLGRSRRGPGWAVAATVVGAGAAAGLLVTSYRPERPVPDAAPGDDTDARP
jgi:putative oxidoreductase